MCGINGYISSTSATGMGDVIKRMNCEILHRGPDENGEYVNGNVAMGMQRLTIIDLSTGTQPIFNEDRSIAITFNGEIYNYRDLRSIAENAGARFSTKSDTEVVLKLYELFGTECLQMLNGMFAFAIHDQNRSEVFIARDRFGEKPLYYIYDNEKFLWASELKSIVTVFPELKRMNRFAAGLYFKLSYIPAPYTIYENIKKLQPAEYLRFNTNDHSLEIKKYWDLDLTKQFTGDYTAAKKQTRELLTSSIDLRMVADVPLGVFLSGGVDSSIVAAVMSSLTHDRIQTFSIGFADKRYDESDRARAIANHIGSSHHEFIITNEEMEDVADRVIMNYDEPFGDSSAIPTYIVASKTVSNVKVALTGDGGDEMFAGYNKYMYHQYRKWFQLMPAGIPGTIKKFIEDHELHSRYNSKSFKGKAIKFLSNYEKDELTGFHRVMSMGLPTALSTRLLRPAYQYVNHNFSTNFHKSDSMLRNFRYIDKNISLEGDMLVKVDRASMLCSLECRAPFLDHRVAEFAFSLPDSFLIKGRNKKRILKDSFASLLPENFFQATKSGFEMPISEWLRRGMRTKLESALTTEKIEASGVLNPVEIRKLLDQHFAGILDHGRTLWLIYCFMKWFNSNRVSNA